MKTAAKLLVVPITHGVLGVFLYGYGTAVFGSIDYGNFLMLYLPAIVALVANTLVLSTVLPSKWHTADKVAVSIALAVPVTFLSLWAYMVVALNHFGA